MVGLIPYYFSVFFVLFGASHSGVHSRRVKRIVNGDKLPSHDLYNTHFVVSLMQTFECLTDQFEHKLDDCEVSQACGGSLIREDFVLTACHCVVYEDWFYFRKPPVSDRGPAQIPSYIDSRIHNRPRKAGDPIVYPIKAYVKHPLLNTMTIFAGSADRTQAPQRRHAAKFFPHHLCAQRESAEHPELWSGEMYEMDFGLVKACYPFHLTKDVKLAVIKPITEIESHLGKLLRQNFVCLFVGWGLANKPRDQWDVYEVINGKALFKPAILQHAFRFLECNEACAADSFKCVICSQAIGPRVVVTEEGDSGSPLICEGYFTGVHSSGNDISYQLKNDTTSEQIAVACVKDFITDGHLSYLRSTIDEHFHWLDGNPVTFEKDQTV